MIQENKFDPKPISFALPRWILWVLFALIALPMSVLLISLILRKPLIPNGQVLVLFFRNMVEYLLMSVPPIAGAAASVIYAGHLKHNTDLSREIVLDAARRMRPLWVIAAALIAPTAINMYFLYMGMPRPCIGSWACSIQYRLMIGWHSGLIIAALTLLLIASAGFALTGAAVFVRASQSLMFSAAASLVVLPICMLIVVAVLNSVPSMIANRVVPYVPELSGQLWAALMVLFALLFGTIGALIYTRFSHKSA